MEQFRQSHSDGVQYESEDGQCLIGKAQYRSRLIGYSKARLSEKVKQVDSFVGEAQYKN
jgi:hypothetical protein